MRVLIAADVHIDDYSSYNWSEKARLRQFDALADRLVELGREQDCQEVWLLGDIVNRPNSRKYIEHTVKQFIGKLSKNFQTVRYILGQHDLDSKSQEMTLNDTLISLFDFPNMVYMDRQTLREGDRTYGFMNWRPEQSLDWLEPEQHLDVLFGHFTKSEMFGQEIDESRFDLMIHGDIHSDQVIGKFVSVCNPIQHDLKSQPDGKVVVFDTETAKWKHVDVDPDHSWFLRIAYTSNKLLDGFQGPLQYNVYRPSISADGEEKKSAISWENIDELIEGLCGASGVLDVHREVESKCVPYSEVDFNFQLDYLRVEGYRSIVELEVDFSQGDRVILLGNNGSGKSSVVKALRAAFMKNSLIKYEKSDFTEDTVIVVGLTYQGKRYEITKGDRWGLKIDGEEQSYSNLTGFESDLQDKLPFIGYLNLFFLTSDIQNLSNQLNSKTRIDLISRFYRLDRIKAYNETATNLSGEVANRITEEKLELEAITRLLERSKIKEEESVEYNSLDKAAIERELEDIRTARDKDLAYAKWNSALVQLQDSKASYEQRLQALERSVESLNLDSLVPLRDDLKRKLDAVRAKIAEFSSAMVSYSEVNSRYSILLARRDDSQRKLDSVVDRVCPECGSVLDSEVVGRLRADYDKEVKAANEELKKLDKERAEALHGETEESLRKGLNDLRAYESTEGRKYETVTTKIKDYDRQVETLRVYRDSLRELEGKIEEHKEQEPERVTISPDLRDRELKLVDQLAFIKGYEDRQRGLIKLGDELEARSGNLHQLEDQLKLYAKYVELTSPTGEIIEQVLVQLADKFSSEDIRYVVESGVFRNNRFVNFNTFYRVRGKLRPYSSCSDGQITVCDIDFLSKLFSVNVGLLVLDEYFKHLDDFNLPVVSEMLMGLSVNTLIVSTHDSNFTAYNKKIMFSLDDEGRSVINVA